MRLEAKTVKGLGRIARTAKDAQGFGDPLCRIHIGECETVESGPYTPVEASNGHAYLRVTVPDNGANPGFIPQGVDKAVKARTDVEINGNKIIGSPMLSADVEQIDREFPDVGSIYPKNDPRAAVRLNVGNLARLLAAMKDCGAETFLLLLFDGMGPVEILAQGTDGRISALLMPTARK